MKTLPRNFGWSRLKLATHSYAELQQLEDDVKANHSCQDGIHLLDPAGRKKLDAITWAVFNKQKRRDDA